MKKGRRSKTVAQQCKYYEVDNFFDLMIDAHVGSCDPNQVVKYYKELNREGKRLFVRYCFTEMNPEYLEEVITKITK